LLLLTLLLIPVLDFIALRLALVSFALPLHVRFPRTWLLGDAKSLPGGVIQLPRCFEPFLLLELADRRGSLRAPLAVDFEIMAPLIQGFLNAADALGTDMELAFRTPAGSHALLVRLAWGFHSLPRLLLACLPPLLLLRLSRLTKSLLCLPRLTVLLLAGSVLLPRLSRGSHSLSWLLLPRGSHSLSWLLLARGSHSLSWLLLACLPPLLLLRLSRLAKSLLCLPRLTILLSRLSRLAVLLAVLLLTGSPRLPRLAGASLGGNRWSERKSPHHRDACGKGLQINPAGLDGHYGSSSLPSISVGSLPFADIQVR
jgi:hypothetical protein